MSAWSCPHDIDNICQRVLGARCDPGMRGCVLEGRVRFAREQLNMPRKPVRAEAPSQSEDETPAPRRPRLPF
ncbi:hypothetical protein [Niveibacterium sp.]|uniref:hypothetical protein n=1 Tax=Niveibacterium sp. TaxID=2017444 RepID=UPI0035AFD085